MTDAPLSPALTQLLASMPTSPGARIETADVDYRLDGTPLQGYVAVDSASTERRPGVLLVHDLQSMGYEVTITPAA